MNDLQTLVATILGALLILVAVWLIAVRRDPARNSWKGLGIELDLSTPGIAVLVAGCGLLALPAFVPHRPGGLPSFGWLVGGPASSGDGGPTVLEPVTVLTDEQEPNDNVPSANRIELGQTIEGTLGKTEDSADYFALAMTPDMRGPKRVIVRTPEKGCSASLTVWNEKEEQIGEDDTCNESTMSVPVQPANAYFIRVSKIYPENEKVVNYEVVVEEER